jgi:hypothetical protein
MKTIQVHSVYPLDLNKTDHVLDLENGYTFIDLISKILYKVVSDDFSILLKAVSGFNKTINNKEEVNLESLSNVNRNIENLLEVCVTISSYFNYSIRNERIIEELEKELSSNLDRYSVVRYMLKSYILFNTYCVSFSTEDISKVLFDNIKKSVPVYSEANVYAEKKFFCKDVQRRYFFTTHQKLEDKRHDLFFLFCLNLLLACPIRDITNLDKLV